eukprot:TRINITY_DN7441_c0_g2_i1.p1 TRINITY_DN7441_c0_g2~~TRINITY_DN7441_c0_g2_i1.p1  ORF type:complete len:760 (-),score=84.69 TRINITY_DN7441_c0_g2_i1:127-2406(-)
MAALFGDSRTYSVTTLRFHNESTEAAFVASRYDKLCTSAMFGLTISCLYISASLVSAFTIEEFDSSPEGLRLYQTRSYVLGFIAFFFIPLLMMVTMARRTKCCSGSALEFLLAVAACLITVLAIVQHPWYLAKALRIEDPRSIVLDARKFNEDRLLLYLDMWLTGCHLVLRMRWFVLTLIDVVCVVAYLSAVVLLGPQADEVDTGLNLCLLIMLTLAASWGKRALEIYERTAFTQLAEERTLRYRAEHQLSRLESSSKERPEVDAASLANSMHTAEAFDLSVEGRIEEQLRSITAIGVKEHWLIKPERLQLVENGLVGNGSFGMVVLAQYHGADVVLKVPRVSEIERTQKVLKTLAVELRIFRRLHHPHIVAFHGACIDPASANIVLVLEHVRGVPLKDACSGMPSTPKAFGERWMWADNVCAALAYLHAQSPNIIHGDVKDCNVLVEEAGGRRTAKLLDFGLSRLLTNPDVRVGGTLRWMAPEVIATKPGMASTKVDVFSFGRLLYQVMTGRVPLDGRTPIEIRSAAQNGKCLPLQWPDSMPLLQATKDLCNLCSRATPSARPDMIHVQSTLRGWWLQAEDGVRDALRQAFPHQVSSESLRSFFAKAKAESADDPLLVQMQRCMHGSGIQQPHTLGPSLQKSLIHDELAETPYQAKQVSLASVLSLWNVPNHLSCCSFHARLRALDDVSQIMQTSRCVDMGTESPWQCQHCCLLGEGECDFCSGEAAETDIGEQERLEGEEEELACQVGEKQNDPLSL